jgi:tetratricopeptide (TPR) repeat protein
MRMAAIGAAGLGFPLIVGLFAGLAPAVAASPISSAVELYKQRRYVEARAILEPLAASEPSNPAASYFLGMTLLQAGGPSSLESAHLWLGRAVKLAPDNAGYLAEYAGVCFLIADRDSSFLLALEGRDAMTRAIAANPRDVDGRDGLMQFYAKAPWPLGDPEKALSLAAQIATIDPKLGISAYRSIAAIFGGAGRKEQALIAAKAAQNLALGLPH